MGKFLKLNGFCGEGIELVNSDNISTVQPEFNSSTVEKTITEKGFFGREKQVVVTEEVLSLAGSKIFLKNGKPTYVSETPEQIYKMLEGA